MRAHDQISLCVHCLALLEAPWGGLRWRLPDNPTAGGLLRRVEELQQTVDGVKLIDYPDIVVSGPDNTIWSLHAVTYILGTGYCAQHARAAGFS